MFKKIKQYFKKRKEEELAAATEYVSLFNAEVKRGYVPNMLEESLYAKAKRLTENNKS